MKPKNNYSMSGFAVALVLILMAFSINTNAQCFTPYNVAKFGVEGDMRANTPAGLLTPPPANAAGVPHDDWFFNVGNPGDGIGIIGTEVETSPSGISAADFRALIQGATTTVGRNRTYVQRMSVDKFTVIHGSLLLDAVAARDNHTAGGAVDSTAFAAGPDKNGANPNTWTIGVAGVQQKNDLIDVGGHIRRDFNSMTGMPGDLWGYAFATTRNTSGDAHTDFEVFRTAPELSGTSLINTGPNGGHTAGRLNTDGTVLAPGDLLVSIDYANGGTNPQYSVRIWVNPNDLKGDGSNFNLAQYNAISTDAPEPGLPGRQFVFTGAFDGGTGSGNYGYAEIVPIAANAVNCLFFSVVNDSMVAGPVWGNLTAQNAAYSDNMDPLVNVEVAINFTKFGLNINPVTGPCYKLFGSLCVKTRSSSSFTSEMKDFAGPFIFGDFAEVNANAGSDKNLQCSTTQVTLDGSTLTPGSTTYSWSVVPGSGGNIVSGANTLHPVVNAAGCYVLEVSNPNFASCSAFDTVCVVGVPDITPPTVSCPPAITRTCTSEVPAGAITLAGFIAQGGTASDISGTVNVSYTDGALVGGSCGGTITRTYNFTDACGNATSCTQIITINDNIPPTISGPADQTFGCNPTIPAADINLISASDNCTGVTVTVLADQISGACTKTLVRTYRATDGCGNTADWVQAFTYTYDVTAPAITASGSVANNSDLGCNPTANQIDAALGSASATDACGAVTVDVTTDGVVSNGCSRSQTRNFSSTDGCGNTATDSRTITWKVDNDAPTITATGSVADGSDLGCNPSAAAIDAALGTASATDNCDIVTVSANDGAVSANGCQNTQTRTFTSTDACGNTSSVSRTISWKVDLTAPTITAAGSVNDGADLGCNPSAAAIDAALGTATATDNCDIVTVSANDGAVSANGCQNTQTRTFTSTDACGNTSSVSRTISWKVDLTAPTITATGSVNDGADLGCNPSAAAINAALGTATATDNCDIVTVSANDGAVSANGCQNTQTRTFTSTDACGNTSSVSRTISWKVDLTAPTITAAGSVNDGADLGCNPSAAAIDAALGTATATDNCDIVTVSANDGAVSANGCQNTQTRTFTSTDACGNTSSVSRTISWKVDLTAPTITATGSVNDGADLGCNPSAAAIDAALGTASATDNCDIVTVSANDGAVSANGCQNTQTRTFTSTDACGNTSSVSRTISWKVDLTAPTITATGSVNDGADLGCNPSAAAIDAALGTASATDNCDIVTVSANDGAVSANGCQNTQTRTFTSTDACGNTSSVSRTISWKVDLTAPTITATGSVNDGADLGCNPSAAAIDAALGTASATDNCDIVTVSANDGAVSANGCQNTQTRTFTSTDACGNSSSVSRTISWKVDLTAPTITAAGSVNDGADLGCNPSAAAIDAALGTATATDNCDIVTVSANDGAVSANGCQNTQTRTFTSTDACGNTSSVSRTISWKVDLTAPTITATGSVNDGADLGCNPSAAAIDAALGTATATDNCDIVTVSAADGDVTANGCQNTQTRTFTSTDACGNTSSVSRTISWKVDLTAPVVTCNGGNGDITVCVGDAGNVSFASTATDNCDGIVPVTCVRGDGLSLEAAYPVGTTTVTCTATDACGNSTSCSFNVIVLANPTCNLTAPAVLPLCGSAGNTLSAASANATSYSWSVSGNGWAITAGANTAAVTYTAGNGPATFTLTVTNSLNGVNCTSTCSVTFSCSADRFCTYTQGYYGAAGGANCSGLTTKELLKSLLLNNPLVVGGGSNRLTCVYNDAEYGRVFLRLPAGGTSLPLNGVATFANPVGIAINSNGTFGNTLVGQTLTLGFNMRLPGSGLANLRISGKYLTTAQSSGSGCVNPAATPVAGTNQTFLLPAVVVNYLGANNKISDLYALANLALANQLPSGAPSIGNINAAVDAINRAFDACRMFVSFSNVAPTSTVRETDGEMIPAYDLSVKAYPNPFSNTANIEFSLTNDVDNAVVEVYTLSGTKVATLFNGSVEANKSYKVELDGSNLAPGIYVYQVNTGDHVYTNKLILTRE